MEDANTENTEATDAAQQTQATEVQPQKSGWENIEEVGGLQISILGMAIVFTGLLLTSGYIALLPIIAGTNAKKKPAKEKRISTQDTALSGGGMAPELQAAITYVIAAEHEYEKMTDYTKITIRRDINQQVWGVAGKMRSLATRKISKN